MKSDDIAIRLGCITVDNNGTKRFDIKKFLSTEEGRDRLMNVLNSIKRGK